MWQEFKRQLGAGSQRRSEPKQTVWTINGKTPVDSKNFRRMSDEDLEDMDELQKAYVQMLADAND